MWHGTNVEFTCLQKYVTPKIELMEHSVIFEDYKKKIMPYYFNILNMTELTKKVVRKYQESSGRVSSNF